MSLIMFQDWDCTRTVFDRETDKDLVSKSEDEMEKGTQDGQYERHANASNAPRSSIWSPSYGKLQILVSSGSVSVVILIEYYLTWVLL